MLYLMWIDRKERDTLSLLHFFPRSFKLSLGYIRTSQENVHGLKFYRTHQILISVVQVNLHITKTLKRNRNS
jgi:hypothetical protein